MAFRKTPLSHRYAHTLRFGFSVSSERSLVTNISTVLRSIHNRQSDRSRNRRSVWSAFTVFDSSSKTAG